MRSLWARQIERAENVTKELAEGGDAIEAREALRHRDEVYVRALRNGDGAVFVRHYPQLFGRDADQAIAEGEHPDEAAEDMVEEAQGGSQTPAAPGRRRQMKPTSPRSPAPASTGFYSLESICYVGYCVGLWLRLDAPPMSAIAFVRCRFAYVGRG